MGREVRRVPAGWNHPKNYKGHYIPLHDGDYAKAASDWDFAHAQWANGLIEDWKPTGPSGWRPRDGSATECARYTDWAGPRPSPDDYMPTWPDDQRTHLMMYEDTSEGTPISPAFETPEALARWLANTNASAFADQGATYEQWLATCRGAWAPSMVMAGGKVISGVEFAAQRVGEG